MATYYWVGGSGNWSDAAAHWSNASGGSPSASYLPTAADDVVFDAASNVGTGTFTVTIDGTSSSPSLCNSFSTGGAGGALDGAMTLSLSATAYIDVYGSLTLPATNFTWSGVTGARVTFRSTSAGNTITTNGVSLTGTRVQFDGVGGSWTLGSALTYGGAALLSVVNGTFSTANYNLTGAGIESSGTGTRSISLGSSTATLSGAAPVALSGSNLTFNAGTSTIACSAASITFAGGGYTFYTVNITATSSNNTSTITGANTFTNLSQTTPAAGVRRLVFDSNQTISGTLTLGAANTAVRRVSVRSDVIGTQRTLTVATLATLADVDFGDIKAAGASSPWSGTRIGDCGNNTDITVTAASDKYWYSATGAGGNWSAAQWETTAGGTTPSVNNFPLPQDTVKFQDTGLNSGNTLTIDGSFNLPSINGTARTLAMTLASGSTVPTIFGDLTLVAVMTLTGTGSWRFAKQGTQSITTNGVALPWPVNVESGNGTFKAIDNITINNTLQLIDKTIDCNNNTITCTTFTSSNSRTRSIAFGTGKIAVTGNNATVCEMRIMTNFTYTGTPLIEFTYSGSTGTRTLNLGFSAGATESNALSIKISAGTDTVATSGANLKNLDFTGFSGTSSAGARTIYGNLTLSATMTWGGSGNAQTFAATSGTQTITANGITIDSPVTINAPGATVSLADALTLGSTRTLTFSAGTLKLKNGTTSTAGTWSFSGTVSNPISLQSTSAGAQATISQSTGTVNSTYLTVKDIVATGGATFNAFTGSGSTTSNNNVNNGNNLGWYFIPPGASFIGFF